MASPQPDVTDRLDVTVAPGGKVIAISDLHLPPERTTVSGRSCEVLARRIAAEPEPVTVVLAGDIVEMLATPAARPPTCSTPMTTCAGPTRWPPSAAARSSTPWATTTATSPGTSRRPPRC